MALDLLLVHPGNRHLIYQALGEKTSAVTTPIWCGMIAHEARAAGLSVAILDAEAEDLTAWETANRVAEMRPRVAAIVACGHQPSASTQNLAMTYEIEHSLRVFSWSGRILILGGAVATIWPTLITRSGPDTFHARGDGTATAIGLAKAIRDAAPSIDAPGLIRRDSATTAVAAPPVALDHAPRVAYDLMNTSKYRAHNHHALTGPRTPYASLYASLGCSWRCDFCCIQAPFKDGSPNTVGTNAYILKPPNIVVEEIDWLVDNWGATTLRFDDEMFGLNRRWLDELCDLLSQRPYVDRLNLWAYSRIDQKSLAGGMLEKMRAAGFRWICPGIESAVDRVRDGVGKGGYGVEDTIRAVRAAESAGIEVLANFIVGLPDDTEDTIRETFALACELNTAWLNVYSCLPYVGSKLYEDVSRDHPEWLPETWDGYSQHSYATKPLPTKSLSAAQVLESRDRFFVDYFSRPEYEVMLRRKFEDGAVAMVREMLAVPMRRKLLGDPPPGAD